MEVKEIKRGKIHCFTDCGYNCLAQVRIDLLAHYNPIAKELGAGWLVDVWHNGGWHAKLYNEKAGFYLSDRAVDSGIKEMVIDDHYHDGDRWECFNYDAPEGTSQIWVYGSSPKDAIRNAYNEAASRAIAYMTQQSKLLEAFP